MGTILRGLVSECLSNFSEDKMVAVVREAHHVLGDGRKVHGLFCDMWKVLFPNGTLDDRKALYARLLTMANLPSKNYGKTRTKADVFARLDAMKV